MRGFMWCQSLCIYACVAVFGGSIEPTEFTAELHNYLMELEQEQEDHWSRYPYIELKSGPGARDLRSGVLFSHGLKWLTACVSSRPSWIC